jgi:hypothetical protein
MTIGMVDEAHRHWELSDSLVSKDTTNEAMVFCQACRHGGHASHILDWFFGGLGGKTHSLCPVADCECRCAEHL